jgi:hypothetical protein
MALSAIAQSTIAQSTIAQSTIASTVASSRTRKRRASAIHHSSSVTNVIQRFPANLRLSEIPAQVLPGRGERGDPYFLM